MSSDKGKLIVISGPSGSGKSSICNALRAEFRELRWSVSATTRPMRAGETNGQDYFFLSEAEFLQKVAAGDFLEYASVHGHYYGTLAAPIDTVIAEDGFCLLDIDVQGAAQVKTMNRYRLVLILIEPPDIETLRRRLSARGKDAPDVIEKRVHNAMQELAAAGFYTYRIVNANLPKAIEEARAIILRECFSELLVESTGTDRK